MIQNTHHKKSKFREKLPTFSANERIYSKIYASIMSMYGKTNKKFKNLKKIYASNHIWPPDVKN